MCRLLGTIAKKPADLSYWFFESKIPFRDFSEKVINGGPHKNGWGIAWLEDEKWNIFKQGEEEKPYDFNRVKKINSLQIIAHLRHASSADISRKNAHPFQYENWVFEHNGGVDREKIMDKLKPEFSEKLTGQTDSEAYFYLMMQNLQQTGEIIPAIKDTVNFVKKFNHRGLNFLMSDGHSLYAFRDVSPKCAKDYNYYCLHYLKKKDQVIFSSDKLSDDEWIPMELGELWIVDSSLRLKKVKI